jgi:hypothetical protein
MPLAMAILSGAFAKEERAWALGIFSGITGCALIIGPCRRLHYRDSGMAMDLLDQSSDRHDRHRLGAGAASREFWAAGRTGYSGTGVRRCRRARAGMGLLRGNLAGWASAEIISPLAAGTLFAAAFVAWELRASAPMVPMRLFQSRAFSSGMNAG